MHRRSSVEGVGGHSGKCALCFFHPIDVFVPSGQPSSGECYHDADCSQHLLIAVCKALLWFGISRNGVQRGTLISSWLPTLNAVGFGLGNIEQNWEAVVLPGITEVPDPKSPGPSALYTCSLGSLHKQECFTYFLSGASAFQPLPFFMQVVCGHSFFWVFVLWFRDNLSLRLHDCFSLWNSDCTITILHLPVLMARKQGFPSKVLTVSFNSSYDIKMFHQMWEDLW